MNRNNESDSTGVQRGPQVFCDEISTTGEALRSGGRVLTGDKDLWTHNAWDKVEWDEEQELIALAKVEEQRLSPVSDELRLQYNADPASYWDVFYAQMKDRFFNDRAWLRTEFTELADVVQQNAGPKRVVEIGCGPGNTLFPLLAVNENEQLQLHGLDFSKEAIDLVKANPAFDSACCHAQVWDLASAQGLPSSIEESSVDIAIMIFVLSALHPDEWSKAVENVWKMLKPGGVVLFRDYGRNDMTQLRFKKNRFMQPGLYVRGDHTRVYFFERDELITLFGSSDAELPLVDSLSLSDDDDDVRTLAHATSHDMAPASFELLQLGIDRRLLLNRKMQLKMYRIWLQGRWRKPV